MRGVTIIVAGADLARFEAALTLANAQAALGGRARLFLNDAAVTLSLDGLLAETALELGVEIIACQTALDLHGVALSPDVSGGGMIGVIGTIGDDRLIFV